MVESRSRSFRHGSHAASAIYLFFSAWCSLMYDISMVLRCNMHHCLPCVGYRMRLHDDSSTCYHYHIGDLGICFSLFLGFFGGLFTVIYISVPYQYVPCQLSFKQFALLEFCFVASFSYYAQCSFFYT